MSALTEKVADEIWLYRCEGEGTPLAEAISNLIDDYERSAYENAAAAHRHRHDSLALMLAIDHDPDRAGSVAANGLVHTREDVKRLVVAVAQATEETVRANVAAELAEAWERGFMFSYGLDRGCTVAESHDLSPYRSLRNGLRVWNPYTDDTDEEDPYE